MRTVRVAQAMWTPRATVAFRFLSVMKLPEDVNSKYLRYKRFNVVGVNCCHAMSTDRSTREQLKSEYARDDPDVDPDDETGLSGGGSMCCIV